jgi:hypothetical protein
MKYKVAGNFILNRNNNLASLEGCPIEVDNMSLYEMRNLQSLKGIEDMVVNNYFHLQDARKLKSLEYCPKIIGAKAAARIHVKEWFAGCFAATHTGIDDKSKVLPYLPKFVKGNFLWFENGCELTEEEIRKVCEVEGHVFLSSVAFREYDTKVNR